jgi:hypothetical protein
MRLRSHSNLQGRITSCKRGISSKSCCHRCQCHSYLLMRRTVNSMQQPIDRHYLFKHHIHVLISSLRSGLMDHPDMRVAILNTYTYISVLVCEFFVLQSKSKVVFLSSWMNSQDQIYTINLFFVDYLQFIFPRWNLHDSLFYVIQSDRSQLPKSMK